MFQEEALYVHMKGIYYLEGRSPSGTLDERGVEAGEVNECIGCEEKVTEEGGHNVQVT